MTLYVGSMLPDRSLEESELIKNITGIASNLKRLSDHPAQKRAPILDIVYLLPSSNEQADFNGMRLHSFDSAGRVLRIEASVPEKMVSSKHAEQYAIAIMQDAIDAAKEYFSEQNILFDADSHMALVDLAAA
ncbi:MAG: hypothetical protein ACU836_12805 [Gammaproteobacteria bacterium]